MDPSCRIAAKAFCRVPLNLHAHPWADLELQNCHRRKMHRPQVTTDPSSRMAAKAPNPVAWICCTPLSWSCTAELSPPLVCIPPGDDGSIFQNRSKGPSCGLNLLYTPELILNCRTVTAILWLMTAEPQVTTDPSSRIAAKAADLRLESAAHPWADLELPNCHRQRSSASPQVMMDPSSRIAAKAPYLRLESAAHPWADLELPNCHRHSVHSPRSRRIHLPESQQRPQTQWLESAVHPWADLALPNCHRQSSAEPQVTTDPSSRIAAKALFPAWICCTPLSWSCTAELSPPQSASPHVTTDPSSRIAAKALAICAAWICCDILQLISNCWTVPAKVCSDPR